MMYTVQCTVNIVPCGCLVDPPDPHRQVCEAPALLHQRRTARVRALLRGAPQAHLQQWHAQPAAQLARAPGHQVQEADHATHHLHGRQHQGEEISLEDDPVLYCTLHTVHCTVLYTAHCTLYCTVHCILYIVLCNKPTEQCVYSVRQAYSTVRVQNNTKAI